SAERHRCDVHAMLAKQSPDSTDHTGAIGIFEHENHPMRPRFHWTGVDANDSWSNSKKCPADRYVFSFRSGRKFEHVGIIAGRAQPGLGDFQSQTFCECGRAYFIHFAPTGALQKAFEHGARDGGGIDFVNFSAVVDVERIDPSGRELREKAAEFFAETQMWPNQSQCFRVERRHVYGIANRSLEQGGANGLRDFDTHALLRLGG